MGKGKYREVECDGVAISPSIMSMYPDYVRVGDKLYHFLTDYYTNGYSYPQLAKKHGVSAQTIKKIHDAAVQTSAYVRLKNVLESGVASFTDNKFKNVIFDRLEKEYKETQEEMEAIPAELALNKLDYRKHLLQIISKMAQITKDFTKMVGTSEEDAPKTTEEQADQMIDEMKKEIKNPEIPKAEVH